MFKKIIKFFIPRYFLNQINILLKRNIKIKGSYRDWNKAILNSGTFQNNNIYLNSKKSFVKVLNGEAIFERDSVIFKEKKLNKPFIQLLEKTRNTKKNKFLKVLDFGGSFGSTYFQNKYFLSNEQNYQWDIIEQIKVVNFANKSLKINNLTFQKSLDLYLKNNKPDIVLFSSVIHYLEFPFDIIKKLIKKKIKYFLILKTPFFKNDTDIRIQINPKYIYKADYPIRIFNEKLFKYFFINYNYKLTKLNWDTQEIDGINFKSFFIKYKNI
jgi:putative methyltransferase (TIGR04325 family)